jgi:hypothetical protein
MSGIGVGCGIDFSSSFAGGVTIVGFGKMESKGIGDADVALGSNSGGGSIIIGVYSGSSFISIL